MKAFVLLELVFWCLYIYTYTTWALKLGLELYSEASAFELEHWGLFLLLRSCIWAQALSLVFESWVWILSFCLHFKSCLKTLMSNFQHEPWPSAITISLEPEPWDWVLHLILFCCQGYNFGEQGKIFGNFGAIEDKNKKIPNSINMISAKEGKHSKLVILLT